ncbi:MAG: tetratricopeptide repeat protein [Myxococcales bacterium]|nr:tetratricopeptide repeat protein [Myxococcales bacterium]
MIARRLARALLVLVLATGFVAVSAHESAARRISRKQRRAARKAFRAGQQAYRDGKYAEAAKHFEAGYKADPRPRFLINVAQSYRQAGDLEQAKANYQRFLELAPKRSTLRPQVERLVAEIDQLIAEKKRKEEARRKALVTPPPATTPPPGVTPPPAGDPNNPADGDASASSRPVYKRWWFWTAIGAAVAAGVVVGVVAGTQGGSDYVEQGGLGSIRW